jgi:plasmid stabilization system protein ParE
MRPEPKFTPEAQADVADAAAYYSAQRPNLGYEFLEELQQVTSLIREAPLLATLVDDPIRRRLIRRFPYGVFYVPGAQDEPDVAIAVVDLRQDPEVVRKAYQR